MSTLKVNQSIRLTNGSTAVVQKELGRGGQGIVYLVEISGKKMALKWYLKHPGQAFYKNLSDNVASGAPAPNFIWPLGLRFRMPVHARHNHSYGKIRIIYMGYPYPHRNRTPDIFTVRMTLVVRAEKNQSLS